MDAVVAGDDPDHLCEYQYSADRRGYSREGLSGVSLEQFPKIGHVSERDLKGLHISDVRLWRKQGPSYRNLDGQDRPAGKKKKKKI